MSNAENDGMTTATAFLRKRHSLFRGLRLLKEPVPDEKKRLMRARWHALDARWRTGGQGLGQQATGCGATIGVHPRCDFACTGCYLGVGANQVRPSELEEIFRQLDGLRVWLGPKGNVQITDGEVTLLPVEDLVTILRYARRLGLIPMLMTHGDTFRRRRGLLERLMIQGGLTELSIHIDTTQQGRVGYRNPASEAALEPLRKEFADMIRAARRTTRLPLRAATTVTLTRDNLADVGHVVNWCLSNRDAFGMLSFQPVAQVGRTLQGLPGVTVTEVWSEIEDALADYGLRPSGPRALLFGHPDCNRVEPLVVYERVGSTPRILPIVREGHEEDAAMMRAFFVRGFGGINFRDDTAVERVCRTAGVFVMDPGWIVGPLRRWVLERLAELGTSATHVAWDVLRRNVRIDGFCIVSHHFMNPTELATPLGQERLSACSFRVPVGEEMVPMCRVNAGGLRDDMYAERIAVSGDAAAPSSS
jgi:MoaA/NifB/PqqE/SkfB family radical SAM enzyme